MVNNRNSAGFTHPLLLAGLFTLILLVIAATFVTLRDHQQHARAVHTERARYATLDSQAQAYIQAINEKYPGEVTHIRSCSYTSTEGGRGSLSCDVETTIEYKASANNEQIITYADALKEKLPWATGKDISDSERKDTLYFQGSKQTCEIRYYQTQDLFIASVCSGGALAEYYPVINK
jgi:hypothetical protein